MRTEDLQPLVLREGFVGKGLGCNVSVLADIVQYALEVLFLHGGQRAAFQKFGKLLQRHAPVYAYGGTNEGGDVASV